MPEGGRRTRRVFCSNRFCQIAVSTLSTYFQPTPSLANELEENKGNLRHRQKPEEENIDRLENKIRWKILCSRTPENWAYRF